MLIVENSDNQLEEGGGGENNTARYRVGSNFDTQYFLDEEENYLGVYRMVFVRFEKGKPRYL